MAQTSTTRSTTPTASSEQTTPLAVVTISQEDADRCANNTRELVAARDEIAAYSDEIASRDKRDANTEKLLATYERALAALDRVIAEQDKLSSDKTELIKAQTDLIKTLMQMPKKKSPLQAVFGVITGILLGRSF